MIRIEKEEPVWGIFQQLESSVFVTVDKHSAKHRDFSDMEAVIVCGGEVNSFSGETQEMRKENLKFFNRSLKETKGIDVSWDGKKFFESLVFFDSEDEYATLKKALIDFAVSKDAAMAFVAHRHQVMPKKNAMIFPHVHILCDMEGISGTVDSIARK